MPKDKYCDGQFTDGRIYNSCNGCTGEVVYVIHSLAILIQYRHVTDTHRHMMTA